MRPQKLFILCMALTLTLALGYGLTAIADMYPPACPPAGSGADGVAAWAEANCQEGNCVNPATTCNREFTIELTGTETAGDLMTFHYKVCRLEGSPAALSHWIFSTAGITCLGEGFALKDLVVDLKVNGDSIPKGDDETYDYLIGLDPTTQIDCIKFEPVPEFDVGYCKTFSVTFDLSKLDPNYTLGRGCVVAATKAGAQDIRRDDRPTHGYACIVGPVCVLKEQEVTCTETAYGKGEEDYSTCFIDLNLGFNNWGWTNQLPQTGTYEMELWAAAGQCDTGKGTLVGTVVVDVDAGTVTYNVTNPYKLLEVHLYVGDTPVPQRLKKTRTGQVVEYTVAPGQYGNQASFDKPGVATYTFRGLSLAGKYVIAHAVVDGFPCPPPPMTP